MIEGLFLVVLLGLSAFFSGSETALIALSRARADALAEAGRPGAGFEPGPVRANARRGI